MSSCADSTPSTAASATSCSSRRGWAGARAAAPARVAPWVWEGPQRGPQGGLEGAALRNPWPAPASGVGPPPRVPGNRDRRAVVRRHGRSPSGRSGSRAGCAARGRANGSARRESMRVRMGKACGVYPGNPHLHSPYPTRAAGSSPACARTHDRTPGSGTSACRHAGRAATGRLRGR